MTLKVIRRLQTFTNAIPGTFVWHFTRFQLTVCSHGSSALAELLVLGGTTPTFLRQIVGAICCLCLQFCLLISVIEAWQWSRMLTSWWVGKNSGRILSCLWVKDHDILRRCRRLCNFHALAGLCMSFLLPKIEAVKFAAKLRRCRKRWFWAPDL